MECRVRQQILEARRREGARRLLLHLPKLAFVEVAYRLQVASRILEIVAYQVLAPSPDADYGNLDHSDLSHVSDASSRRVRLDALHAARCLSGLRVRASSRERRQPPFPARTPSQRCA